MIDCQKKACLSMTVGFTRYSTNGAPTGSQHEHKLCPTFWKSRILSVRQSRRAVPFPNTRPQLCLSALQMWATLSLAARSSSLAFELRPPARRRFNRPQFKSEMSDSDLSSSGTRDLSKVRISHGALGLRPASPPPLASERPCWFSPGNTEKLGGGADLTRMGHASQGQATRAVKLLRGFCVAEVRQALFAVCPNLLRSRRTAQSDTPAQQRRPGWQRRA